MRYKGETRRNIQGSTFNGEHDILLAELCNLLFASLPRSDQRRRGMEYVRGLLETKGRKSIRNIATMIGGQATEQSLHHFICHSTWDWAPVRQALVQYLARTAPPQAWVVRPMVIPKAGEHSVGVGRWFCPTLGQALNAQQTVGVWAASEEMSSPVGWRLHLSQKWLTDTDRRHRASIPAAVVPETPSDCTVAAVLEAVAQQNLPAWPVVLDIREMEEVTILHRLQAAGVPVLARISSTLRLVATHPPLPGRKPDVLSAHHIMAAARDMRRPVLATHHGPAAGALTRLAATVRVRLPRTGGEPAPGAMADDLTLLGISETSHHWPGELWVTDLNRAQPAALVRLSRLIQRVDRDFTQIAEQVGIRDFAGRSYTGWHHHVTLASVAHTVAALVRTAGSALHPLGPVAQPA